MPKIAITTPDPRAVIATAIKRVAGPSVEQIGAGYEALRARGAALPRADVRSLRTQVSRFAVAAAGGAALDRGTGLSALQDGMAAAQHLRNADQLLGWDPSSAVSSVRASQERFGSAAKTLSDAADAVIANAKPRTWIIG